MKITIRWTAFQEHAVALAEQGKIGNAEISFDMPVDMGAGTYEYLLNVLYQETNLQNGGIWETYIKEYLPLNRSHTSLSVGDRIAINDQEYVCEMVGWSLVNK